MPAGGRPLSETLTALLLLIEEQSPEMLCSILLLNADGVLADGEHADRGEDARGGLTTHEPQCGMQRAMAWVTG